MGLVKGLLAEFDHEMKGTRRTLERVPDDKLSWKPHPKSFTFSMLASHLAQIPGWLAPTIEEESLNVSPPGKEPYKVPSLGSREEILKSFDDNVAKGRAALEKAQEDQMFVKWSLLAGDRTVFTIPRVAVVRGFILSHTIHHRAQLGLYLRMNDIPVPALYGPSNDEASA